MKKELAILHRSLSPSSWSEKRAETNTRTDLRGSFLLFWSIDRCFCCWQQLLLSISGFLSSFSVSVCSVLLGPQVVTPDRTEKSIRNQRRKGMAWHTDMNSDMIDGNKVYPGTEQRERKKNQSKDEKRGNGSPIRWIGDCDLFEATDRKSGSSFCFCVLFDSLFPVSLLFFRRHSFSHFCLTSENYPLYENLPSFDTHHWCNNRSIDCMGFGRFHHRNR